MQPHQLQELFEEHSAALVLYARQWCALPDDAVQEAFIDLARVREAPDCPQFWLYTTTRRKAQNIARAEQRRRTHQLAAAQQYPLEEGYETWFRPDGAPLLVAEDGVRGLEKLSPDERELLVARVWGGLNFEQLARLLDCSLSSAHRRYSAALRRLRAILVASIESTTGEKSFIDPPLPSQQQPARIANPEWQTEE